MDRRHIIRMLAAYGVTGGRLLPAEKGYRNHSHPYQLANGGRLNLIVYKAEPDSLPRLRRVNDLSNQLYLRGLPSRRQQGPVMRLSDGRQTRYAALYEYLPGETIAWEAYQQHHIKLLGQALSTMHSALASIPAGLPDVIEESTALAGRMRTYFADAGVRSALSRKLALAVGQPALAAANRLLLAGRRLPQHQPLHMDFVRGNVLFSRIPTRQAIGLASAGGQPAPPFISGILDFEKAASGPPVFDIARSLAFLLVDCKYKQPHKVIKYFVESGYRKRGTGQLDGRQRALLGGLTRFYLLHDFYKFLLHNPYEYLPQNEHFVRTRDFLLKDGIIKQTSGARRAA